MSNTNNLPKYITDERTGLQYELVGDYYLIAGDDEPEKKLHIGKWGRLRDDYLKKEDRLHRSVLIDSGELYNHLADIEQQAEELFSQLVIQLAEKEGVTEAIKSSDQVGAPHELDPRPRGRDRYERSDLCMSSIFEELWNGNIAPYESIPVDKQLLSLMGRNRERLDETLTEQQKELLEKYDEAVNEMHSVQEIKAFSCLRLITEALTETK